MTQAKALLQEAMGLRTQVGQEFVSNVLTNTPPEFKAILAARSAMIWWRSAAWR